MSKKTGVDLKEVEASCANFLAFIEDKILIKRALSSSDPDHIAGLMGLSMKLEGKWWEDPAYWAERQRVLG